MLGCYPPKLPRVAAPPCAAGQLSTAVAPCLPTGTADLGAGPPCPPGQLSTPQKPCKEVPGAGPLPQVDLASFDLSKMSTIFRFSSLFHCAKDASVKLSPMITLSLLDEHGRKATVTSRTSAHAANSTIVKFVVEGQTATTFYAVTK